MSSLVADEINFRPDICYFGKVQVRGIGKNFGILQDDRRRHMYILGKTGMGKSTLLENMILQDIYNGHGVCFLDPHSDSAEYILDRIPENRKKDVIYFNPSDTDFPFGFNMLEAKRGEEPFLITSGMMAIFNRIWAGTWSARMEYILTNTILALLEVPNSTLLGVIRMLTDKDFRSWVIGQIKDPLVRNFWVKEWAGFNEKYRTEAVAPVLNKIGQFFSTDLIRNVLAQEKSTIDFRDIMDNKKIFIVNLSKGRLGDDNSAMLGSFLITKLQLAAMSRVDIPEHQRQDFYVYVDEFQNFTTDSFATILSEARKYRLSLILAHQYIAQLTEEGNEKVKNAIFGNVGTMLSFRVGATDGMQLEKEFEPVFMSQQLISLNKTQIAIKLSINGKAGDAFLANTLPPLFDDQQGQLGDTVNISRNSFGRPKDLVKSEINKWLEFDYGELLEKEKEEKIALAVARRAEIEAENASQSPSDGSSRFVQRSGQNNFDDSNRPKKPKKRKPNPFLKSETREDRSRRNTNQKPFLDRSQPQSKGNIDNQTIQNNSQTNTDTALNTNSINQNQFQILNTNSNQSFTSQAQNSSLSSTKPLEQTVIKTQTDWLKKLESLKQSTINQTAPTDGLDKPGIGSID